MHQAIDVNAQISVLVCGVIQHPQELPIKTAVENKVSHFMFPLIRKLLIVFAAVMLCGCDFNLPPAVSANIEHHQSEKTTSVELSAAQLQQLISWFSSHRSGWSSSHASYAPVSLVRVRHANGDVSVVNIMKSMIVVYNQSGQYTQNFSGEEINALRRAVGLPNG
ncbi:hypothetical protein [Methyloversatilis sp.]|uniref:hypothetical protein n=1 Tax=Methyloversatilis sp. TaxID=2569862 RepID=UPI0035B49B71